MSEYAIRALDATTWDAIARLVEKHNGCGFGGCLCTWFRMSAYEGEVRSCLGFFYAHSA